MNDGMELEIVTLPAKLSVCSVMRIDFDRIDVKFILVKIDFFFFWKKLKLILSYIGLCLVYIHVKMS
jgi:hypothetical protein